MDVFDIQRLAGLTLVWIVLTNSDFTPSPWLPPGVTGGGDTGTFLISGSYLSVFDGCCLNW